MLASLPAVPAIVLLAGFGLRLFVASQDPVALQNAPWGRESFELLNVLEGPARANSIPHVHDDYGPLHEDSHYCFGIARNIALGRGVRHDSFNLTNGFQPLYTFLIVPIFLATHSRTLAITGVLWLQSLLGLLCGVLLYRLAGIVAPIGRPWIPLLIAAIWAFSPVFLMFDINGLETGTAFTLLCLTLCHYLVHFTRDETPPLRAHIWLGVLLGLAFLARNDQALLAPALLLDVLLRERRAGGRHLARRVAAIAGPLLLVASPWLAYNLALGRSLMPASGHAVRFISQAYGFYWLGGESGLFPIGQIPLEYYALTLKRGILSLLVMMNDVFPLWAGLTLIVIGFCLAPRALFQELRRIWFVFAYLVALFLAYTCYIFGQWFFQRYFFPLVLGYLLLISLSVHHAFSSPRAQGRRLWLRPPVLLLATAALVTVSAYSVNVVSGIRRRESTNFYYEVARWLNKETPEPSVIGLFQSGVVGYYLDRRFCGLDGKINGEALQALENGEIDRYISARGIDYVADWPLGIRTLLVNRVSDQAFLGRLRLVQRSYFHVYAVGRP